jgi:hypothetical protein
MCKNDVDIYDELVRFLKLDKVCQGFIPCASYRKYS